MILPPVFREHRARRAARAGCWLVLLAIATVTSSAASAAAEEKSGSGLAGAIVGGFIAKELLSASLEGARETSVRDLGGGRFEVLDLRNWQHRVDIDVCVTNHRIWDDKGSGPAPEPAVCILDARGERLCLEKATTIGRGLKKFRVPWHCGDSWSCSYRNIPAPEGEFHVLVADYDVKQLSLWNPMGTGNLIYEPIDQCSGRLGGAFTCEHGNARVVVSPAGSAPPAKRGVDRCIDNPLSIARIWSEQFGPIGRRTNYVPGGAGLMSNTLKRLFVGPNRQGLYRFGVELDGIQSLADVSSLNFALRTVDGSEALPLRKDLGSDVPDERQSEDSERLVLEAGDLGSWAVNSSGRIVVFRDDDHDNLPTPGEEELAVSNETVVLPGRLGNLKGGFANYAATRLCSPCEIAPAPIGAGRPGDTCELCLYGKRFSDAWLNDTAVEGATSVSEVRVGPTLDAQCLNPPSCTQVQGDGCPQPALCLYNNIGLIFDETGTAPMRWNTFDSQSDLASHVAASPSLGGLFRRLVTQELQKFASSRPVPEAERSVSITLPTTHDFGQSGPDYSLIDHALWGKVALDGTIHLTLRHGAGQAIVTRCEVAAHLRDVYQWSGQPRGFDLEMAQVSATYNQPGASGRIFGVEVELSQRVPSLEGTWRIAGSKVEQVAPPTQPRRAFMGWRFAEAGDSAEPVIDAVKHEGPAALAGFLPGDRIKTISGTKVANVGEVRLQSSTCMDRPLPVTVERNGELLELTVSCAAHE